MDIGGNHKIPNFPDSADIKIVLSFRFPERVENKKSHGFKRLFYIFSNVLRTMTGILEFYKSCAASLEKCWRLPHNLVFILRVEN